MRNKPRKKAARKVNKRRKVANRSGVRTVRRQRATGGVTLANVRYVTTNATTTRKCNNGKMAKVQGKTAVVINEAAAKVTRNRNACMCVNGRHAAGGVAGMWWH